MQEALLLGDYLDSKCKFFTENKSIIWSSETLIWVSTLVSPTKILVFCKSAVIRTYFFLLCICSYRKCLKFFISPPCAESKHSIRNRSFFLGAHGVQSESARRCPDFREMLVWHILAGLPGARELAAVSWAVEFGQMIEEKSKDILAISALAAWCVPVWSGVCSFCGAFKGSDPADQSCAGWFKGLGLVLKAAGAWQCLGIVLGLWFGHCRVWPVREHVHANPRPSYPSYTCITQCRGAPCLSCRVHTPQWGHCCQ